MNLSYDLHIHSCLSPCGDDEMTPANIAGMAAIKGLDVIAVTDHNSCKNCPAVVAAAATYGILAIAGMEICTVEEVHAVCLFSELKKAMEFDQYVYDRLIRIANQEEIFGKQQIYDLDDQLIGTEPFLLINSVDISFDALSELTNAYGGMMFPAHIDKTTNSLLSNLGFIPPDSQFNTVELKDLSKLHQMLEQHQYLKHCTIISNSDAHYLSDIHEPFNKISVSEKNAVEVIKVLRNGYK